LSILATLERVTGADENQVSGFAAKQSMKRNANTDADVKRTPSPGWVDRSACGLFGPPMSLSVAHLLPKWGPNNLEIGGTKQVRVGSKDCGVILDFKKAGNPISTPIFRHSEPII
jgi:hypothetical protein